MECVRHLMKARSFLLSSPVRVVSSCRARAFSMQQPPAMEDFSEERVRNFSIVAHVDHGKSTLADRLLETTGVIDSTKSSKQVLDHLPVERERGITVKAQTATMFYNLHGEHFLLNLIDTPGHVDFSYEVSRSLAASQGVLLLVDAQQGVQAQTVANFLLSFEANLSIIPVINKIDLPLAKVDNVLEQLQNTFGFFPNEAIQISAKYGTGVEQIFSAIIDKIPSPSSSRDNPLRMLLFDSWYDHYRGVVCVMAVKDGSVGPGDKVTSSHTGLSYEVAEVGLLQIRKVPTHKLYSGQVGYCILGMRDSHDAQIGDTFHHSGLKIVPLPGFKAAKPMVFAGVYPMDQSEYPSLRTALDKLTLNDRSVSVLHDSSVALGQGWRLGFLGLLHMDVFRQRLEEEFDASILVTTPSVPYKAFMRDGTVLTVLNPAQFPEEVHQVKEFQEPIVLVTLVTPDDYLGSLLQLCQNRRGTQKELLYMDQSRVLVKYILPLSEVVIDFYDQVKSLSSGYASCDYEDHGYQPTSLVKMDILLNGHVVDALAMVVHKDVANTMGRSVCIKLKDTIHRQLFEVAIQAAIGKKVIARESVKALRKDVTAKCYGGDISRKMKLLKRQKEGKKRMKQIGNVQLSKDAFLSILQR